MKFNPKNTYNIRNIIGKWDEFRSITEKDLIDFFKKRKGWTVRKRYAGSQLGIDIIATYKNDISISILAGEGAFSMPHKLQKEYSSVEIAILKNSTVTPGLQIDVPNRHIKSDINKFGASGYINFLDLRSIVEGVEKL